MTSTVASATPARRCQRAAAAKASWCSSVWPSRRGRRRSDPHGRTNDERRIDGSTTRHAPQGALVVAAPLRHRRLLLPLVVLLGLLLLHHLPHPAEAGEQRAHARSRDRALASIAMDAALCFMSTTVVYLLVGSFIFCRISSRLNEAAFCRCGYSLNVARNWAT